MRNISRRKLDFQNGRFLIKKVFGLFLINFNRNAVNSSFILDGRAILSC